MTINRRELFENGGGLVAGLALASVCHRLEAATPENIIRLSGNENSYGPSPAVLDALNQSTSVVNRYSYDMQLDLVDDIAKHHGVDSNQIILGAGSTEAIYSTMMAHMSHGGEAVSADLTHGLVFQFATATGGTVIKVPVTSGLEYDLDAIHTRITPNTKLVYICNPNNPSGTLIDGDSLRDFCTSLPENTVALIDEAYIEYTDDYPHTSMVDMVRAGHNVVVTRTFSKIHGLAGLRVGYAIAPPDLAGRIATYKVCRFQGPLGAMAAKIALNETQWQEFCRDRIKEGREVVYRACEDLGLNYVRSSANCVFIDPGMSHAEYGRRMLEQGIGAARQFPPMSDWARITIGTSEEMEVFSRALPAVIGA